MATTTWTKCLSFLFLISLTFSAYSEEQKKTDNVSKKAKAQKVAWSYQGETGPENWANLSKDNYACSHGVNQSPIDIKKAVDAKLKGIEYDYGMIIGERVINNGHTIQIDVRSGGTIQIDGKEFALKQFHYHSPSEHQINGKSFPLEVHFVHQSADGQLAVVAMPFKMGLRDPIIDIITGKKPLKPGESRQLGPKDLVALETTKKLKGYERYNGSLTTPPCTEGVIWIMKKTYLRLAQDQLVKMRYLLGNKPNNRPVQPLNARVIMD